MPVIENLKLLRDQTTNKSFTCTATEIAVPQEWRTAISPAATRHGGVDAHAGSNDYLAPRAISVTILHKYLPGETFKSVSYDLERVITRGNPLELTFVESDGEPWLFENVRLTRYDKKMNRDLAVLFLAPLAFIAPDPRQRAQYEVGVALLDNGLFLDDGLYLDDSPNTFDLSGTQTVKTLTNIGSAPDDAPIVTLQGRLTGAFSVSYYDDANNRTGWYMLPTPDGIGLHAGETLTVDAEQPEVVSSLDPDAYARFRPFDNQEGWGRIAAGTNTVLIQYAAASAPASCHIRWYPRR